MTDVRTCLADGAERLRAAGIENPWREARLLLSHVTGFSEAVLIGYPERIVCVAEDYISLVNRRTAREPISHITGQREFWSLSFAVTPDTLDPRPDSETVIEAALAEFTDSRSALHILDLGTGSGCLLAALLSIYPAAWGLGVDRNPATALVASRNLSALGMARRAAVIVGDWGASVSNKFNLVVSNPPYIPTAQIETLQPEVSQFDPRMALDGGPDGLDAYRRIALAMPNLLRPDGRAVIEFGDGQSEKVSELAAQHGLHVRKVRADLAGRPRCLVCSLTKS